MANQPIPLPVTLVMYIMGMSTLLPWNLFITANSYWQYKLRNVTLNDSWNDPEVELTSLQVGFTPAFVVISNVACFFFGFFTSAISKRVNEKKRILGSLILSLVSMVFVTLLSFVNTDDWQDVFFGLTLIIVGVMNVGIAVLQASLYGMVGLFPSACISALVSGQSLAGIVSALSQIISLAIGQEDPVISGIIYFCLADVYLIISIMAYVSVIRMEYYKESMNETQLTLKPENRGNKLTWKEYIKVFRKVFWFGLSLGFIFMVTISVYPSVEVYVTSVHSPSAWADVYFQPTITFLVFGVADMVGRELSRWVTWPGEKGRLFHVLSFSRVIFIPLILLCHGSNKTFPTLFNQDFYYIIINILFGLTDGYFGALGMIFYPRVVEKQETELAGTLMASLMGVGMVLGACASPGFVALWGPKSS